MCLVWFQRQLDPGGSELMNALISWWILIWWHYWEGLYGRNYTTGAALGALSCPDPFLQHAPSLLPGHLSSPRLSGDTDSFCCDILPKCMGLPDHTLTMKSWVGLNNSPFQLSRVFQSHVHKITPLLPLLQKCFNSCVKSMRTDIFKTAWLSPFPGWNTIGPSTL